MARRATKEMSGRRIGGAVRAMGGIVEIREQWAGYARHVLMEQEGRGSVLLDIYDEPAEHGRRACIHGLYVREDSRGRGIGRMLIDAAEGIVRKSGCGGCVLHWSASSGMPALAWLLRRGYMPMRAELAKEFPAEVQDADRNREILKFLKS